MSLASGPGGYGLKD